MAESAPAPIPVKTPKAPPAPKEVPPADPNGITMSNLQLILEAVGIGIDKEVYSKEQIKVIYPVWDKVSSIVGKYIRKQKAQKLLNKEESPKE